MWLGIIVTCLMTVYPPWIQELKILNKELSEYGSYSWIFHPPSFEVPLSDISITEENKQAFVFSEIITSYKVRINYNRLFIKWICVVLLTLGLIITFKNRNN